MDTSQFWTTDTDEPQTYPSQYKITSWNEQWNYIIILYIMRMLMTAFIGLCTTIAGFKDWACIILALFIMLAFLTMIRQWRARSEKATSWCWAHITTPTGSIPSTYSWFTVVVFSTGEQSSVYFVIVVIIVYFLASSIALATLQLKKPSKLEYMNRIIHFKKT